MKVIHTYQVEKCTARVQMRAVRQKKKERQLRGNLEVKSKGAKGSDEPEEDGPKEKPQ